jgi:hypothetical protein
MRAAIVGGTGYEAGKHAVRGQQAEATQNQGSPISRPSKAQPPAALAAPAAGGSDVVVQLESVKKLVADGNPHAGRGRHAEAEAARRFLIKRERPMAMAQYRCSSSDSTKCA